ncbi:MAG: YihY/virulence factor BrkB family protein [Haloarculaceae archaeon]
MQLRTSADTTVELVVAVVAVLHREETSFLAAGIAYYAFVSLVPASMLLFAVASFVGGEALAETVLAASGDVLSPVGRESVRAALEGTGGRAPATLVGFVVLVWSSLKVFRGIDVAFSQIHGIDPASSFLERVRDAAVALGGVSVGVAAVVVAGVVIGRSGVAFAGVLGTLALVVVLATALFPLYYLLPVRAASPALVLPGTAVAAAGWTLLGTVFRAYASVAGGADLYGALGAVLLLVTWFYVGSLALLVGAALNAVLAGRGEDTGTNKAPPADMADNDGP